MGRNNLHVAVAEELAAAMARWDIDTDDCSARPCGHIAVVFRDQDDATALLAAAVPFGGPGSLQDRACGGLLTLVKLADSGVEPDSEHATAAFDAGWAWSVYPSLEPHGIDWHLAVDLPVGDAAELTATLNAAKLEAR